MLLEAELSVDNEQTVLTLGKNQDWVDIYLKDSDVCIMTHERGLGEDYKTIARRYDISVKEALRYIYELELEDKKFTIKCPRCKENESSMIGICSRCSDEIDAVFKEVSDGKITSKEGATKLGWPEWVFDDAIVRWIGG